MPCDLQSMQAFIKSQSLVFCIHMRTGVQYWQLILPTFVQTWWQVFWSLMISGNTTGNLMYVIVIIVYVTTNNITWSFNLSWFFTSTVNRACTEWMNQSLILEQRNWLKFLRCRRNYRSQQTNVKRVHHWIKMDRSLDKLASKMLPA